METKIPPSVIIHFTFTNHTGTETLKTFLWNTKMVMAHLTYRGIITASVLVMQMILNSKFPQAKSKIASRQMTVTECLSSKIAILLESSTLLPKGQKVRA